MTQLKPRLTVTPCGLVTMFHGFDGLAWAKLTVCLRNGARPLVEVYQALAPLAAGPATDIGPVS